MASNVPRTGRPAAVIFAAHLLCCLSLISPVQGQAVDPVFVEDFSAVQPPITDRWILTGGLDAAHAPLRIESVFDSELKRPVSRFTVQLGDAQSGVESQDLYVCGPDGSRLFELERDQKTVAPSERVEVEIRHDRTTGAGELVRFGETVWYRFAFRIPADWPADKPTNGRPACRTVIHQIKQDSFKDGKTCSASPFFKIEARPWGNKVKFFAQITYGAACAEPPDVHRAQICAVELPKDKWTTVNVRLLPSHDRGQADIWLDGKHCGHYEGPMADPSNGAMRDGKPFINAQPRFGIYRDRRPETQTIYFDRILFWNQEPGAQPDWMAK